MSRIETIKQAIMADPQNKAYTDKGIEPLFAAPKTARINIKSRCTYLIDKLQIQIRRAYQQHFNT